MIKNYSEDNLKITIEFLRGKGLNEYAVFGLVANIYKESHFYSNNLQNSYENKLNMNDEQFTKAVDSGEYDFLNSSSGFGYGLCQWTSKGRRNALYNYIKASGRSIADTLAQLEYMWIELTGSYKKSVLNVLLKAESLDKATRVVMLKYERPKNQTEANQLKRVGYAQEFYDKYAIAESENMTTVEKILNIARAEIGVKESPKNSNNVKYNTEYYGREVNSSAYAWCCVFIWWLFKQAGVSNLFCNGKKTASCTYVKNTMKKQIVDNAKAGDLVLFQFDKDSAADHIGIIEKVNSDGTYTTIEGNTAIGNDSNGGEVMRRTRKKSLVMCFIRPAYNNETTNTDSDLVTFIKGVQESCGAKVDGIAGKETLSKTVTVSAYKNRKHAVVKHIQKYLNALGYNCGTVDGVAGAKFTVAVKRYQDDNSCTPDGVITAKNKTWKKLLGLL